MAASVGKSRRRSATKRPRGLRASERGFAAVNQASRGCERRQSRLCRGEEERAEAFFPPPSDDELGRSKAAMREQQAPKKNCASSKPKRNSVGPSKYELQGPTV